MDALNMLLAHIDDKCPDIKVLYTLWLGDLTIEVMDKRTGKTHGRTFPGVTVDVINWVDKLQEAM